MKRFLFIPTLVAFFFSGFGQIGTPYLSFGANGNALATIDFDGTTFSNFRSSARQTDGKILAVGYATDGEFYNPLVVARFIASGEPDLSFGTGGKIIYAFPYITYTDEYEYTETYTFASAVTVALQGEKILVAGTADIAGCYVANHTGFILRFNNDGTLDNSFGEAGLVLTNHFALDDCYATSVNLILVDDDKILAAIGPGVLRLNYNGDLDNTWGSNGIVTGAGGRGMLMQGEKILTTAGGCNSFVLKRYNNDGSIDVTFGTNGEAKTDFSFPNFDWCGGQAEAIALDGENIVVAGNATIPNSITGRSNGYAVAKFHLDGSLDESFGVSGKVTTDLDGATATSIDIRNGKIVVSGSVGNSTMGLVAYNNDGTLDPNFGDGGKIVTALNTNFNYSSCCSDFSFGYDKIYIPGFYLATNYVAAIAALNYDYELANFEISCPSDKEIFATNLSCEVIINNIDPIITPLGNPVVNYKIEYDGTIGEPCSESGTGSVSGKAFKTGMTNVTYSLAGDPTKTCSFIVTVIDNQYPVAKCKNVTVHLDQNGAATLTAQEINDNSSDNCSIVSMSVYPNTFSVSDIGAPVIVQLTVTDAAGNSNFCQTSVIVECYQKNTYYKDTDLDGHGNPNESIMACIQPAGYVNNNSDCDDGDNTVYQGASEICDEKDNDCDGEIDDGLITHTFYPDEDRDGFGDPLNPYITCGLPPFGYVSNNLDCNDQTILINAGANEECDGLDNDCDGQIDEDLEQTFYIDADGDGYGNPEISLRACAAPDGYVANNTDCNDIMASVHPGATELCGNNTDENCNGQVDEGCFSSPTININDVTVYESQGLAVLTVSLSSTTNQAVKVRYETVDGTAVSKGRNKDFAADRGVLTIPAGSLTGSMNITIHQDNLSESAEYFDVILSRPVNATIGDNAGRVTILDGSAPTTRSTNVNHDEIDNAVRNLSINISPNPFASSFNITVQSPDLKEKIQLKVINITGQLVESKYISPGQPLRIGDNYRPGTYLIQAMQGNQRKTVKVIKLSD